MRADAASHAETPPWTSPGDPDGPYSALRSATAATHEEMRSSYLRRVLKAHPDKGGTAEEFQRVTAAFEVPADSERRTCYLKILVRSTT